MKNALAFLAAGLDCLLDLPSLLGRRLGAQCAYCVRATCVPELGGPQREREVCLAARKHGVHARSVDAVRPVLFIEGVLDFHAKHVAKQ